MGLKWLIVLIRPLDVIGEWYGEDQRASIIMTHVERDWTMSLSINIYSTFDSEHNQEDLCIQSRNQQTFAF